MERITENSLRAKIRQAQFWRVPDTNMTICALTLRNGFVVTGQSAATQAEFNAEKGKEIAYDDAFKKLWPLEMYRVRSGGGSNLEIPEPLFGPSLPGMQTFVGVKVIHASKMTRGQYCRWRDWPVPDNENPADAGYLVEYSDKLQDPPTMPGFKGYVSWSPADVFEAAYSEYRSTARKDETPHEFGEPFTTRNDPDEPLTFDD